ncbi:PEPxxWA-CTERM sorting domain-containing protein (plasmid) [Polymorphobacter sp. PAMC 29334]|uniref:PEPxxWA-CTERM sorting domain-containing protein n=1 Tax=Polymorphobacter sp. PAMC 29334 TaxID=2862331 RepID=UPI001C774B9D|nr:PEPxxWA-CTERM sorting domain-containing protein [Polymorphobacter sp. PAMC 29334]QYE33063.1 PEPxxWA-CTERM sorting domain-containing protein [Polymorphobacter sp. PAMC 29334]
MRLSITVGNTVFSKFNQINYGTPTSDTTVDLGSGNFPIIEYLNGSFAGIGGVFHIRHGITIYTDPIAAANGAFQDRLGLDHDFELDDRTSDGQGNLFGKPIFANVASVVEPTSWSMMVGGFGLVGATIRRRKSATDVRLTAR